MRVHTHTKEGRREGVRRIVCKLWYLIIDAVGVLFAGFIHHPYISLSSAYFSALKLGTAGSLRWENFMNMQWNEHLRITFSINTAV